jgi:DHA1 family bicyclomycin/chloramphenicol resistance-like MFS transporter
MRVLVLADCCVWFFHSLCIGLNGLIVANSIAGALSDLPEQAGAVSALVRALQYGAGILGSGAVGAFADGTPWPMGWVIALAGHR